MAAKVMNTEMLKVLNRKAIKADRNRTLDPKALDKKVDPDGIHVVSFDMIHNDVEMRLGLLVKMRNSMEPQQAFLDVSFEDYATLPTTDDLVGKDGRPYKVPA